jgi:pSer/pThr/pTyr-binding forkhead associated (FHA) protein
MNWSEINRREVAIKAGAGLAGGIAGWIPTEIWFKLNPLADSTGSIPRGTLAFYSYYFVAMLLPAFIGMLINVTEFQSLTLTPKNKRLLLLTFLICFALGLPADYWGNEIFTKLVPKDRASAGVVQMLLPRSVSWAELGLLIGFGIGIATFSVPNIAKGAIGGLLGGFIGGLFFDPIIAAFSPALARAFGYGETGLMIGLLIGLVQDLTKTAWLKVEAGRLRNREFRLEKALTVLGRAEECDVGLFGDPAVEGRHARIEHRGNDFVLDSLGHEIRVNGRPMTSAQLNNGDTIEIGNYTLSFNVKAVPAGATAPAISRAAVAAPNAVTAAATAKKAVAAPRLVDASGKQLDLRPDSSTSFGRSQDNDVVLSDKSVSRLHATITPENGGFYLRDLQSQNGTYVDRQRINEYLLRDGDRIQFGNLQFTFRV